MTKIDDKTKKTVLDYIKDVKDSTKLSEQRDRAAEYQDFFRGNQWSGKAYEFYKSTRVLSVCICVIAIVSGWCRLRTALKR